MHRLILLFVMVLTSNISTSILAEEIFGTKDQPIDITIPSEVDPKSVLFGFKTPRGAVWEDLDKKLYDPDFPESIRSDYIHIRNMRENKYQIILPEGYYDKWAIICPGYKTKYKSSHQKNEDTWQGPFEKLPTITLRGKLIDTSGNPMSDVTVNLSFHSLAAQRYFNNDGGHSPPMHPISEKTNSEGEFTIEISNILKDPFLSQGDSLYYYVTLEKDLMEKYSYSPTIDIRESYADPIQIVLTKRSSITILTKESYFNKTMINGQSLSDYQIQNPDHEVGFWYIKTDEPQVGGGARLSEQEQGHYYQYIGPGTYDISVRIYGPSFAKELFSIPIEDGVVIQEGEDRTIRLE